MRAKLTILAYAEDCFFASSGMALLHMPAFTQTRQHLQHTGYVSTTSRAYPIFPSFFRHAYVLAKTYPHRFSQASLVHRLLLQSSATSFSQRL
jgi:hypothetical protein